MKARAWLECVAEFPFLRRGTTKWPEDILKFLIFDNIQGPFSFTSLSQVAPFSIFSLISLLPSSRHSVFSYSVDPEDRLGLVSLRKGDIDDSNNSPQSPYTTTYRLLDAILSSLFCLPFGALAIVFPILHNAETTHLIRPANASRAPSKNGSSTWHNRHIRCNNARLHTAEFDTVGAFAGQIHRPQSVSTEASKAALFTEYPQPISTSSTQTTRSKEQY
jgi:hypothetical protein